MTCMKVMIQASAIVTAAMVCGAATAKEKCGEYVNELRACSSVGEKLNFGLRTGKGTKKNGIDRLWQVDDGPAKVVTNSAWHSNNDIWIGPNSQNRNYTYVYSAKFSIPEDPYYYDDLKMGLSVGADNSVREIRVNGVTVYTGEDDIYDFQKRNFDLVSVKAGADGSPFIQGCNEIEIDVYNEGSATGLTVKGNLNAVCTKCTSPKPTR